MMAGNPNWWNMNIPPPPPPLPSSPPNHHPQALFHDYPPPHYLFGSSSPPPPHHPVGPIASDDVDNNSAHKLPPPPPQSWSQLLLSGLSGEEAYDGCYKPGPSFFPMGKFGSWAVEDQPILNVIDELSSGTHHMKQERIISQHGNKPATVWPTAVMIPVSSPSSCVTTLSSGNNNGVLDFSSKVSKGDNICRKTQNPDHNSTSESDSKASAGTCKKARVQSSSNQPLKVRKEKLGDRITALHQLVSPFGKTDTASVLLEAIGYIRFLQSQIEALSSPYLGNATENSNHHHHRHHHSDIEDNNFPKDLKSRGLCLVPVSCTMQVGNDNIGADYWAPAAFGGSF